MNHTIITAAIVTILATLVAGSGAFTRTAQSADAYNKNDHNGNSAAADGNSQEGTLWQGDQNQVNAEHALIPLPLISNRILKIFFPIISPG
jgi:hypothetical protein